MHQRPAVRPRDNLEPANGGDIYDICPGTWAARTRSLNYVQEASHLPLRHSEATRDRLPLESPHQLNDMRRMRQKILLTHWANAIALYGTLDRH